jgi:hypothetical protein
LSPALGFLEVILPMYCSSKGELLLSYAPSSSL